MADAAPPARISFTDRIREILAVAGDRVQQEAWLTARAQEEEVVMMTEDEMIEMEVDASTVEGVYEAPGASLPATTAELVEEFIRRGELAVTAQDHVVYTLRSRPTFPWVMVECQVPGCRHPVQLNDHGWRPAWYENSAITDRPDVAAAVIVAIFALPGFYQFRCGMQLGVGQVWPYAAAETPAQFEQEVAAAAGEEVMLGRFPVAGCTCTDCETLREQGLPDIGQGMPRMIVNPEGDPPF